ncbi:protein of unknown function [Burkholderia multivorans]
MMSVQPISAKRTVRQLAGSGSARDAAGYTHAASTVAASAAISLDFMIVPPLVRWIGRPDGGMVPAWAMDSKVTGRICREATDGDAFLTVGDDEGKPLCPDRNAGDRLHSDCHPK